MAAHSNAPVIIKRKKVVGGVGHHGGAWKVAYADFVTAMMAFFMLMWLLNATTEKQRKGIADYFDPTIAVAPVSAGGKDNFSGSSLFTEDELAADGIGGTIKLPVSGEAEADGQSSESETKRTLEGAAFDEVRRLVGSGGESMVSEMQLRHVVTRQTDEGLIIELFDLPGEPLFEDETAVPSPLMTGLAGVMAEVFDITTNAVAVNAHVRTEAVVRSKDGSWALSTARAQEVRELLAAAGLGAQRVQRVTGYADRMPAASNPMAVRNNRIEIILLRREF